MDNKDLEEEIFNISEVRYGQDYKRHLLEQYKIYIESAEKISDRRQKTNDFFLAINSALLALFGYFSIRIEDKPILIILMASILGICICYFWYRIIKSYKDMNSGKFKVIHIIEKKLPLALYDAEWSVLGRGEDPKLYLPFTHIEIKIPWIFIIFYLIILLWNIIPWKSVIEFYKRINL